MQQRPHKANLGEKERLDDLVGQMRHLADSTQAPDGKPSQLPWIMSIPIHHPFKLDASIMELALKNTPFDASEWDLQYGTYKTRDTVRFDSVLVFKDRAGRPLQAASKPSKVLNGVRSGAGTPMSKLTGRKKINLSDYKRRKLGDQEGASRPRTPSNSHPDTVISPSKPCEISQKLESSTISAEGKAHLRTSTEVTEIQHAPHIDTIAMKPKIDPEALPSGDTERELPAMASTSRQSNLCTASNMEPEHHSATNNATTQAPPPCPPLVFANTEVDVSDSTSATASQYLSDPDSLRAPDLTSQSSLNSGTGLLLPTDEAFDAADAYTPSDAANESLESSKASVSNEDKVQKLTQSGEALDPNTSRSEKIVKLSYGKGNKREVKSILHNSSSDNSEEGQSKTEKRPRDVAREDEGNEGADAKRAKRAEDAKPAETPQTPSVRTRADSSLATPSSSHSVMRQSIPTKESPPSPSSKWKAEYNRLSKLGTILKREAHPKVTSTLELVKGGPASAVRDESGSKSALTSGSNGKVAPPGDAEAMLGAFEAIESLLLFMTALCALDQCQRSAEGWWGLKSTSHWITAACQPYPHLQGLAYTLQSVIFGRVINLGAQYTNPGEVKDVTILLASSKLMEESAGLAEKLLSRKTLADNYPAAYELSLRQPLGMLVKPMVVVRMGWKMLHEWAAQSQLKGWNQKFEEGACAELQ